jgi:choline monooxygenase
MPEFDNVADFPSEKDDLKRLATATHSGFVFASLDPVDRFDAYVTGLFDSANGFGSAPMQLGSITNYEVAANWALYCENYLEGFHIPYVHRTLNEIVDFGTYSTATFRYSSVQTGLDSDGKVAGTYHFLFPNTMFNVYPWGISVNIVEPITPTRTRVRFIKYVSDRARLEEGAGADLHRVELEDEKVVESVQKGVRSRFYERGRYSPTREQGTHHFHRLIAEFIG